MRTKNLLAAALAASTLPAVHAEFVYQNSTVNLNQRLGSGNIEVGDEIILGGTSRVLSDFDFQYYGISFSGNETARVRFYKNDGALVNNAQLPNSVFYDSGSFAVSGTPANGNTLNFHVSDGTLPTGVVLPEHFTISVQFSGIDTGESAGLSLYSPPSVGSNYVDYWYHDPSTGWERRISTDGTPIDFGARIQAVPEPSTWALTVVGGLLGAFFMRRNKRS